MSSRFDLIAQQLLRKSFSDCTVSELQQLTEEHPYLAPAQFLLVKKMMQEGDPEAKAQVQKAALYYHQPAAFDAFLNSENLEQDLTFWNTEVEDEEVYEEADEPLFSIDLPKIKEPETEKVLPANNIQQAPTSEPEQIAQLEQPVAETVSATAPQPVVESPAFEPYHTIDYFASQGIKLSQEEATKDKMGKQLKSFTEWLKTMKKLPATEQVKELDPHSEKKVESLAAHSVEDTEIVTEAMAEVWLKQGNLEKAAEVYHKLSLSNPAKNAYFAAKLERLKKKV